MQEKKPDRSGLLLLATQRVLIFGAGGGGDTSGGRRTDEIHPLLRVDNDREV